MIRRRHGEIEESVAACGACAFHAREFPFKPLICCRVVGSAVDVTGAGEQLRDDSFVDVANGKLPKSLRQIVAEGVIGLLAARGSDDREGVWQQARGNEIVERGRQKTVGEISRSAENDEAAWVGWRGHVCQDLVHEWSARGP